MLEAHDDRLTIGRAADCDVVIDDDPGVSRTHLELVRLGDGWVVEDRGLSRNGTWVDGARLDGRRRLTDALSACGSGTPSSSTARARSAAPSTRR